MKSKGYLSFILLLATFFLGVWDAEKAFAVPVYTQFKVETVYHRARRAERELPNVLIYFQYDNGVASGSGVKIPECVVTIGQKYSDQNPQTLRIFTCTARDGELLMPRLAIKAAVLESIEEANFFRPAKKLKESLLKSFDTGSVIPLSRRVALEDQVQRFTEELTDMYPLRLGEPSRFQIFDSSSFSFIVTIEEVETVPFK